MSEHTAYFCDVCGKDLKWRIPPIQEEDWKWRIYLLNGFVLGSDTYESGKNFNCPAIPRESHFCSVKCLKEFVDKLKGE